jgi:hypothetical protein
MTFSSEILKPDLSKFYLVQITARKYVGLGTSIGGGLYTFSLPQTILTSEVYVNGSTATYTHTGGVLTVTSGSNLASSANYVIIEHDLYLTGTTTRVSSSVSGLPDAEWEPRLLEYPVFAQSMKNVVDGVFSISGSSLRIVSTDDFYSKLTGVNDSLSKAPVKVWMCIGSLENNRAVYDGQVVSLSYTSGILSLELADAFSRLLETATFGTKEQAFNFVGNGARPHIQIEDENTPVPITFGYSSPITVKEGWRHLDAYGSPIGPTWHVSEGSKAVRYSPQYPGVTDTISYSAGRITATDILRLNFGTINDAYAHYVTRLIPIDPKLATGSTTDIIIYDLFLYLFCSTLNCRIGDFIPNAAGPNQHGWVCQVGNFGFGSYNLAISIPFYGTEITGYGTPPSSGPVSVPSIPNNTIPAMTVWIEGGDSVSNQHFNVPLGFDLRTTNHSTRYVPFSLSLSSYTLEGKVINNVNFTIDPVAAKLNDTDSGGSSVNPLIGKTVKYAYRLANIDDHGAGLKYVLDVAGMATNVASFSQASTDLDAQLSLTVPFENPRSFGSYLSIAQYITQSTLGVLQVNPARELEYKILDTPGAPEHERDETDILADSSISNIEFQDIAYQVKFENPQLKSLQAFDGVSSESFLQYDKEGFLHRTTRLKEIKHCLRYDTNVRARIAGYLKEPTVEYRIATASRDLESEIGDVMSIASEIVATESSTASGIIVSTESSSAQTNIKINELRGI